MVLTMELSYLQNHYDVTENENGYQFATTAGVDYFLTFFSYPTVSDFLSTNVYMFNIERSPIVNTSGQDDVKVRNTIIHVLELFFQEHEDALITICDVVDGKQFARKRLFDSWYQKFNNNRLIKLESECWIDNVPTFVSLLFSQGHYNKENLQKAFQELIDINFYN